MIVGGQGIEPRYQLIAPFVAFLLLTGMRSSEALAVEWPQIDLEALDGSGEVARVGDAG